MNSNEFRIERDSLGEVAVPAGALFGAQTARAIENFSVSGVKVSERPHLIAGFGYVKAAAARANAQAGVIERDLADAICAAAREVAKGAHDDQFPIDLVHGGGGTAVHMNANEVIANRASELLGGRRGSYEIVHPNDHVNRSQSTNDVFPTALALATVAVGRSAGTQLRALAELFVEKAASGGSRKRLGRTCLQNAVPLTIAETHHAQAHAVARVTASLERSLEQLLGVPIGGTVIGTGIGAHAQYRNLVLEFLAVESGLQVHGSENKLDALANPDLYVDVAAQAVRVATVMAKIAGDLRFLSSPSVGEVVLPAVQVGSSIMPGKINPVIPELVMQISYETRGMATVVDAAVAAGELELNVMEPVIARHLLASLADLGRVSELFANRCVAGLEWPAGAVEEHLAGSRADSVEFAAAHGYSRAAELVAQSSDRNRG
ncbi:MAG: lyase family protein [Solirubrobacteraceae bacterium]